MKREERISKIIDILKEEDACYFDYLRRATGFYHSSLGRTLDYMRKKEIIRKHEEPLPNIVLHFYYLESANSEVVKDKIHFIRDLLEADRDMGFRQNRANFLENLCCEAAIAEGYPAKARHSFKYKNSSGQEKEVRFDFVIQKSPPSSIFEEFRIIEGGIYLVGEVKNRYYPPLMKYNISLHIRKIDYLKREHPKSSFIPCFVASLIDDASRRICESQGYPFLETKAIYLPEEVSLKGKDGKRLRVETIDFHGPWAKFLRFKLPIIPVNVFNLNERFVDEFKERILNSKHPPEQETD